MNPFRLQFRIRTILKFSAILSLFLALLHWSGIDQTLNGPGGIESMVWLVGMAMIWTLSLMIPKAITPRCSQCGRKCTPTWNVQPKAVCPSCRVSQMGPDQRRAFAIWWLIVVGFLFLTLSYVIVPPLVALLGIRLDGPRLALIGFGMFAVLFALFVATAVVRMLGGTWRMTKPACALKAARECAGEYGRETSLGRVTLHALGTKGDPSYLVKGQLATCQDRFERLIGEPCELERPLRIFAFAARESLNAFCRRAVLYSGNHDGVYLPWPTRTIALTVDFAPYRLTERERIVRTLLAYDLLDSVTPRGTPIWIQVGVAHVVASRGDRDELAQLNRRMLASIANGTDLDTTSLFRPSARTLIRHVTHWQEFDHFARYSQFLAQLSSVGEYLAGDSAPADRRERFRQFLKGLDPRTPPEDGFERHFGHGLDELLVRWKAWVEGQGAGTHEVPPIAVQDTIVEHVLPLIESRSANLLDRIQAIRELGRTGYLLGADTLISRLGTDSSLPREELVWSLEAISGLALGDDVQRWRQWWETLPAQATGSSSTSLSRSFSAVDRIASIS